MANVDVYQQSGAKNGSTTINDAIFAIEPNNNVIADVVIMQQASLRQGTHAVKNRSGFEAAVVNLGARKERVELVKVPFVHHNGVVGV